MKIHLSLSLFLLVIASNTLFSQNLTIGGAGKTLQQTKNTTYSGTPYFNDNFSKGLLHTNSGKDLEVPALRYNMSNQQVEYMEKDLVYSVQDSLKGFNTADSSGRAHEFLKIMGPKKADFYEVLVNGKVILLKYYSAKVQSAEDWYTKKQTKTMVKEVTYFSSKDGKVEKLGSNSKSLLAVFSDKQDLVKSFIKDKEPDLKKDEGMIAVFQYYNSL